MTERAQELIKQAEGQLP
jgi:methyltransferase-like protein 6